MEANAQNAHAVVALLRWSITQAEILAKLCQRSDATDAKGMAAQCAKHAEHAAELLGLDTKEKRR